jgi:hypothetical protein
MSAEPEPWQKAALELWVERIVKRDRAGKPLVLSNFFGEVRQWKAGKLPAGVTSSSKYCKTVISLLKTDPRVQFTAGDTPALGRYTAAGSAAVPVASTPYVPDAGHTAAPVVFRSGGAAPQPPSGAPRALRSATDDAAELHNAAYAATYADVTGLAPEAGDDAASDEDHDDEALLSGGGEEAVRAYFSERRGGRGAGLLSRGYAVADGARAESVFAESALLGHLCGGDVAEDEDDSRAREVHLNTHEPFCLVAVGVQGGGKSHSLACVLEACLLPFPDANVVRLDAPMTVRACNIIG